MRRLLFPTVLLAMSVLAGCGYGPGYGNSDQPMMSTGATDMSYLRAKGVQCYGIGPMVDEEDGPKGFGAHSDQERIREESFYKFLQFNWEVVTALAAK